MAIQPINAIKNWFKTGSKPTQQQFWDWIDSFRHKNEKVSMSDVDGLQDVLNGLPSQNALTAISDALNTHIANHNNPHAVTAAQVGLGDLAADVVELKKLLPIVTLPGGASAIIPAGTLVEKILVRDNGNPLITITKNDEGVDLTEGGLQLENGWSTMTKDMDFPLGATLNFHGITGNTVVKIYKK